MAGGSNSALWSDELWTLHAPVGGSLAGTVWVASHEHFDSFTDMPPEYAVDFGRLAGRVERAILSLGDVGRVHLNRWGDAPFPHRLAMVHGAPDRNILEVGTFANGAAAMSTWIIWLIVAVVLGTAEILTTTLAFGLLGLAALLAAGAGFFGAEAAIQFGIFIAASALGLGVARPFALRHIRQPPLLRSGTAALIGRSALVLEEVGPHSGRVRIGGEEWSARSYDETQVIPAGKTVDVMHIEGATALVYPRE